MRVGASLSTSFVVDFACTLALYHLAALLLARGAGLEPATTGSKGRRSTN
jgi:hypothetical protein